MISSPPAVTSKSLWSARFDPGPKTRNGDSALSFAEITTAPQATPAATSMRSIVRRDNGATYEEFLKELAKQSGLEKPSREDLARIDRKRKKRLQ